MADPRFFHHTPPDSSFTGTGSNAWVEDHDSLGDQDTLVGRWGVGTGALQAVALSTDVNIAGGTLSLSTTGVTAGTYGGNVGIPRFDISAGGRVLSASNVTLVATAPISLTTAAGTLSVSHGTSGVAAGTFGASLVIPQLTVNALGHVTVATNVNTLGTFAGFNSFVAAGPVLGTTTTGTLTTALSTTGVIAGTYGNGTAVGQFAVDAFGRMTLATNVNIAGAGTLAVTQGTTTVASVNRLVFTTGATVTSTAAGIADVAIASGTGGSSTWDTIGAAVADGTTANGTNRIVYQVAPTANTRIAWRFTESSAATNGNSTSGIPNQVLLRVDTISASTQSPLSVYSRAVHAFSVSPTAPQVIFNGPNSSLSAPAITFSDALTTGFYHGGGGTMVACSRGGISFQWDGAQLWVNAGSGAAPGLTDLSNATTGLFFGSNFMGVGDSTAGEMARFTGGASRLMQVSRGSADATAYALNARKSRGTVASPTVITTGDDLLTISGYGYVGATGTYVEANRITFDSTGTIADTTSGVGGIMRFEVAKVGAVGPAEIMRLTRATTTGGGWATLNEADASPGTGDLADGDEVAVYCKAGNIVFAQNVGGAMKFLFIPVDGSTTTWTADGTGP